MFRIYTSKSIPNCPYCLKAKAYLDRLMIDYETSFVEDDPEIILATGHKTVPVVFEDDLFFPMKFIGGYSDLVELLGVADKEE